MTATLVGSGPDREALAAQVERLGLSCAISFKPAMPARQAMALGRIMVVPSRSESLPYVVLEAAAGGKPLITTRVGGVPEIYGPLSDGLVPPRMPRRSPAPSPRPRRPRRRRRNRARAARAGGGLVFGETMVDGVLDGYRDALEICKRPGAVKHF